MIHKRRAELPLFVWKRQKILLSQNNSLAKEKILRQIRKYLSGISNSTLKMCGHR